MESPCIHHMAMTYGHQAQAMRGAVKYMPPLTLLDTFVTLSL